MEHMLLPRLLLPGDSKHGDSRPSHAPATSRELPATAMLFQPDFSYLAHRHLLYSSNNNKPDWLISQPHKRKLVSDWLSTQPQKYKPVCDWLNRDGELAAEAKRPHTDFHNIARELEHKADLKATHHTGPTPNPAHPKRRHVNDETIPAPNRKCVLLEKNNDNYRNITHTHAENITYSHGGESVCVSKEECVSCSKDKVSGSKECVSSSKEKASSTKECVSSSKDKVSGFKECASAEERNLRKTEKFPCQEEGTERKKGEPSQNTRSLKLSNTHSPSNALPHSHSGLPVQQQNLEHRSSAFGRPSKRATLTDTHTHSHSGDARSHTQHKHTHASSHTHSDTETRPASVAYSPSTPQHTLPTLSLQPGTLLVGSNMLRSGVYPYTHHLGAPSTHAQTLSLAPALTHAHTPHMFKHTRTHANTRTHPAASLSLPPTLASLGAVGGGQNWCAKCSLGFRMTSDLVLHMRTAHQQQQRAPERPQQQQQLSNDTLRTRREQHQQQQQRQQQRQQQLTCPLCQETFRERHHLSRHMISHN